MSSYNRKRILGSSFEPKQHHLPGYDYSKPGMYHVTIYCHRLVPPLSDIDHATAQIILSPEGKSVCDAIQKVPLYFPFVQVDCYAVMPTHIHILFIVGEQPQPQFGHTRVRLGDIVGKLKGLVTYHIRQAGILDFSWQRDFYDTIIWNQSQYEVARQYIHDNPLRWLENHTQ